jgi:hypothetical protein
MGSILLQTAIRFTSTATGLGSADFVMVANGTRLFSKIDKVLLPDAIAEPTAAGTATP